MFDSNSFQIITGQKKYCKKDIDLITYWDIKSPRKYKYNHSGQYQWKVLVF